MTLPIEMSFQDSTLGEFRKDRITKEGSTLVTFRGTLRGYARMGLKERNTVLVDGRTENALPFLL